MKSWVSAKRSCGTSSTPRCFTTSARWEIPDEILLKPGRLTDEEFEQIKKHPEYGWAILRAVPGLESVSLVVLHHHERMDGKGYPAGLEGDQIPLGARIVCVVDAFDAMLSSRSYRKGLGIDEALRRLRDSSPDQFDPQIVAPFVDLAVSDYIEIAQVGRVGDVGQSGRRWQSGRFVISRSAVRVRSSAPSKLLTVRGLHGSTPGVYPQIGGPVIQGLSLGPSNPAPSPRNAPPGQLTVQTWIEPCSTA